MAKSPSADGRNAKTSTAQASPLPRYLAFAYCLLIIYASLHPLSGWRDPAISPLTFLNAAWPRYWTLFDIIINVLAYFPLGFLLTLALRRLPAWWLAAGLAFLLSTLLSLTLESLQTWLPSRVPSNLDLACNSLGAACGALLTHWYGERFFARLALAQQRLLAPIPYAEMGWVLIGLWLLIQLSPETLLFGAGDLRHLLDIPPALPYAADSIFAIETGITACGFVAIGLLARTLISKHSSPYVLLPTFFFLALTIRTLAAAILVGPMYALAWLTPGAALGLMIGGGSLTLLLLLPVPLRIALAGLALMAGSVLVNITPPNPYSDIALATWRQGHFLNFNGVTRLTASLWPFLALPYFMVLGRKL